MADEIFARPFGVRFDEAISYLKGKLPEASVAWDDLAGPVHAKVFTVAGSTTADVVDDLHQAMVNAVANGTTLTQFRKEFDATVQKTGWAYKGKRGWRTSVIFNANMRSAHMAGRWAQIEANADRRPFLQYRTAGDARVRKQHRQWNGLIFPVGDAFWQTHYPPNGWNCRCTVRAYSQDDLDRKNLQVSKPFDLKMRNVVNRDGATTDMVPVGIDPGWDHNVGKAWVNPEVALGNKLARLPRDLQGLLVDKTISPAYQTAIAERWKAFRGSAEAAAVPKGEAQIVGFLDSATLDGLASAVPDLQVASTAVGVFDTQLSGGKLEQTWPKAWVDDLPIELRNYRAVLWDRVNQVLVVVPQGELPGQGQPRLGTIILQPNAKTGFGPALAVEKLESATATQLLDTSRFVPLAGRVK
jgi:SPP1 gp7 family putative phage head morphogenesis protein